MRKDSTEPAVSGPGGGGPLGRAGQAIALGTELVVGMGLFTFGGYYIDSKKGGGYFWTLCGMGLGFVYGAYQIWKVISILKAEQVPPRKGAGEG